MNIDQATRFSVEFSFESDTFIRYVRRGKGLTMEYNVAFPDERGVLPVTMDFVETAVGSNISSQISTHGSHVTKFYTRMTQNRATGEFLFSRSAQPIV